MPKPLPTFEEAWQRQIQDVMRIAEAKGCPIPEPIIGMMHTMFMSGCITTFLTFTHTIPEEYLDNGPLEDVAALWSIDREKEIRVYMLRGKAYLKETHDRSHH